MSTLEVPEMSCDGCEDIIENAVSEVSGVEDVTADQESSLVEVEGDADTDELLEAVEFAGYEASVADEAEA